MTTLRPIRCLLVDDEPPALDELSYLLSAFPDVNVVGAAMSAAQALVEIARLKPDVVFQDIQMPGGTGFSVLEKAMATPEPPLFVFATAYDQYAIRAFEDNAVDYLLKPVFHVVIDREKAPGSVLIRGAFSVNIRHLPHRFKTPPMAPSKSLMLMGLAT